MIVMPADVAGVLLLQQDVLDDLQDILERNADETPWTPYENLALSAGAFGGSDKGGSLGYHHGRAHQVVSETITTMLVELQSFAVGVRKAAEAATGADDTAAADLSKRADEVHYADKNAYHHARNDQNVVPMDPTPTEVDGGNG